jgi:hypothetical protein
MLLESGDRIRPADSTGALAAAARAGEDARIIPVDQQPGWRRPISTTAILRAFPPERSACITAPKMPTDSVPGDFTRAS